MLRPYIKQLRVRSSILHLTMGKLVIVVLASAALLCAVTGSSHSRIDPKLWSQLVRMMDVEAAPTNTETGTCDNNRCYVDLPGRDPVVLEIGESITDESICVEYYCSESGVKQQPIMCPREVVCPEGEETVHYPNRCCPRCEGTPDEVVCTVAQWGDWAQCSRTCGGGRQVRVRAITFPEGGDTVFCNETLTETQDCNTDRCPIDCEYEWGEFQPCSRTCGPGVTRRFLNIIRQPDNGGEPCPPDVEEEECNLRPCPVDCVWNWGQFTPCSQSCDNGNGGGTRRREPTVIRASAHGGRPCPEPQVEVCGTTPCPEDCIWEWGPYGQCTEPCDGGTRTRSPNVIRAAAHGGRPCPDPETEPCNTQPCPEDCIWEWGEYTQCTQSCDSGNGAGIRRREPIIIRQSAHGGRPCPDPRVEECGTTPCPVDCIWEWGPFGRCSRTCDGGTRERSPVVLRHATHGGRPCPPYILDGVPQTVPDVGQCGLIPCPTMCTLRECTINGQTRCIDPLDDPDNDCVPSTQDNCEDIFNPDQKDVDGDGIGDECDPCNLTPKTGPTDQDNDGVEDPCDNCPKTYNPDQLNNDGDDTGDLCDDDDDNDGIADDNDRCQFHVNPSQSDRDQDGLGNECDNCPDNRNTNQNDADGDGVGNACDNCRFFSNPEQRPDDPERYGSQCTVRPSGMIAEEDNEDRKGLVAEIMERLLEMYYSN